ncbi:zona pellucida sperm-binding protein 3b [Triplophysa rosa]|uniref:Zona pellucida sperm-binding protein 3 n=1 Tax=Triplophysa rosa TaxID=992332 RepID=A0A9W8C7B6_TRIRA|nr:zona pellucida sperm-binding protein 3b [Triplophysa rosa]KAI7809605.1 zona pellucida glycoprotein 3b precursor [Triplophysa rosa]
MWLSRRLQLCVTVFLTTFLIAKCHPRMNPLTLQQGSSASQQLLGGQFQAAIPPTINDPVPQRRPKAIYVRCQEESMEVIMHADRFVTGLPVYAEELWLGPDSVKSKVSGASCGAVKHGENEFAIFAHFRDCGTKLSITKDSLVYSNVLVYSPLPSPDGVLYQEGAVIPIQCQFQRRYNVDSAAVAPTWIPFASTVSAVDFLDFSLRLMSDDWQYERGSNIYFLGDAIHLQASVTLANHLPLLLFVDQCVATTTPNVKASELQYSFIEFNGCLADSMHSSSRSKFLQRNEGNKLNLLLDAFRFYQVASNLIYITCYLKAIPAAYSVSSQNRACSFVDNRWQSVDGNDQVCNSCEPSRRDAAHYEPVKPFRITLAPPVNPAPKPGPADFFHVRPGQSLEPFKALIQSRQFTYGGLSKRGTDSNKDWHKVATLGPLFVLSKKEKSSQSTGSLHFSPPEDTASVTEGPELLNSTEMTPVTNKLEVTQNTESFFLFEDGLFLNASDPLSSEEGSGFE